MTGCLGAGVVLLNALYWFAFTAVTVFTSGVGGVQNRDNKRVNIGLRFIRRTQRQRQMFAR